MRTIRAWLRRLAGAFGNRQWRDAEFVSELESHLEMHVEDNLRKGMSAEEARREALIKLGGVEQTKEIYRERRGLPMLDVLVQDVRFALRMLGKNRGFTTVAVLTLALGIGATTAIFSVVQGVLLRPLPYRQPEQLVRLWEQSDKGGRMNFADPNFEDLRAQSHSFQGVAEYGDGEETVVVGSEASRVVTAYVSRDFFAAMGVHASRGREFVSEEQQAGAAPVALVSDSYWKQALGSPQDLSSVRMRVGVQAVSVIGVMPAGFGFPDESAIWIPRETQERYPSRTAHNWSVIARLRDGVPLVDAHTEAGAIAQRLKQQFGQDTMMAAVAMEPLREAMTGSVRPALLLLLYASAFLLLIACANVVNLMLAQATAREKELSVRTALGAARGRLTRQFLTESCVLSLIGGGLGVLLAYWGLNGLLALAPANLPRIENVSLNPYVLSFSLGTVFLVSLVLGIMTALRGVSAEKGSLLAEGNRGQTGTLRKHRLGQLICMGQVATALVLLVGAGLLGRSLLRVLSVDPGFRTERIVTMELGLPEAPKSERITFLNELLTKLRAIPGVEEVGGTNVLPFVGPYFPDGAYVVMNPSQISPRMEGLMKRAVDGSIEKDPALMAEFSAFFDELFRDRAHMGDADYVAASEGYFKSLGVPLVKGRLFDDRDTMDAPHVAVVSQSLVADKWPNQDPIGRTVEFGNMDGDPRLLTIVGVVGDIRDQSLETRARPTIYVNYRQRPTAASRFTLLLRTTGAPDTVNTAARSILHGLDPTIPPKFRTLSQIYFASLEARRFSLTLVTIFSLTALLLAVAGIYGVTSYAVAQRVREIGVRMALGASAGEVLSMVLKQGAVTAGVGVAFGVMGSLALSRWIQSQLFEVNAMDPATFAGVALLMVCVALLACGIPGRRAARVDPMVALRYE